MRSRASFTLIELLIVIAIVAILAVVVILTLSPAELLKQSRDSNRLSEISTLNTALALGAADVTSLSLGNASTVYVSIPAAQSNCSDLGLPGLPAGWTYACVTSTALRKTDGTGWIPVNLQAVSFKSPLSSLPIDPVNTTSTQSYYTYVTNGSTKYELGAAMDSSKYAAQEANDGGSDPASFESGSDLSLAPFTHGLVGYWKFDEGSGTTVNDSSGYGTNLTWAGTTTIRYVAGKVGPYAGTLNGTSDLATSAGAWSFGNSFTISAWLQTGAGTSEMPLVSDRSGGGAIYFGAQAGRAFTFDSACFSASPVSNKLINDNIYHLVNTVVDNAAQLMTIYVDGAADISKALKAPCANTGTFLKLGWDVSNNTEYWNGQMDDVRIYNRALSAAEIAAIYNATK